MVHWANIVAAVVIFPLVSPPSVGSPPFLANALPYAERYVRRHVLSADSKEVESALRRFQVCEVLQAAGVLSEEWLLTQHYSSLGLHTMRTMVFDVADGWLPNPLWRTLKAVYACQAAGVLLNGMYGAYVFAAHQLGPLQTAQDVEHKLRHVFGLHTTAPDLSLAPPRPPPRPKPRGRRRRKPTNWR